MSKDGSTTDFRRPAGGDKKVAMTDLYIKPMGNGTLPDLRNLLGSEPDGWCWCVAWEVETWTGWGNRTEEENRSLREALWKQNKYNGYILYEGRAAIGWCKVGPSKEWPKFCEEAGVPASDAIYAFTCFGLKPKYQGKGSTHFLLSEIIKDLCSKGVKNFVSFPRKGEGRRAPGEVWTGPSSLFVKAGFRVIRETDRRKVMVLDLT
jgi:hypothetical protein